MIVTLMRGGLVSYSTVSNDDDKHLAQLNLKLKHSFLLELERVETRVASWFEV